MSLQWATVVTCNVMCTPVGDSTGEVHSLKLSPNLRKQTREVKLALATKDLKRAGQLEVKKLANILGQVGT